jgi:CelD/BcsL family acetyltransferase involved in cellulose biosynthesis
VRITVVAPSELGEDELEVWRAFQVQTPALGNPFLAPEFAVVVGGIRSATRVAVLEDGNTIVGFFAFERRSLGYGVPIAPGLTDCQGLVHAPGLEWDSDQLLRACGLAVWEFDHLVEGQRPFDRFHVLRAPSPVIDLSRGFAPYLAERRQLSSRIRDLPRRRRRLEREVGATRLDFDSRDHEALRTLMTWKSAQYRRTGRTDRFARSWVTALVEGLMATRAPGCSGRLSVLYAGDHVVAAHFGLSSLDVIPTWFPAYDSNFHAYSPGLLLHLDLAQAAAAGGISRIDLGRGAKDYKEWLKSYDIVVGEGRVRRASPVTAVHWARRAPVRRLRQVVMEHGPLLRAADRVLTSYGHLRSGSGRNGTRDPAAASRSRW